MNNEYLIINGEKITAKEVKRDLGLNWNEVMESINRLCEKGLIKKIGHRKYMKVNKGRK